MNKVNKRLSVVVGANRGLGLEWVRQLSKRGDTVLALCRRSNRELEACEVNVITGVDVARPETYENFLSFLEGRKVDWLIHNSGILRDNSIEDMNWETIREQFEINSLAPLRLAVSCMPYLHSGAKIGFVTSRMGSIADNTSGGSYGYRMSKAALNMAGVTLAHDLKGREISVALLHPGYVRTDMTGHTGHIDPPESVAGMIKVMDELDLQKSGTFWHTNGEQLPW